MKFRRTTSRPRGASRRRAGFTLAEVLAALVFMAILIPVAVSGLRVANLAGLVSLRRAAAARVGERVLNELIVTGQTKQSAASGNFTEGVQEYHWDMRLEPWLENNLRLLTVKVTFPVQGQNHDVSLSTVVDTTQ